MDIDVWTKREDKPLTREDVERLLHAAGTPNKLNLSGRNLKEVNLVGLDLSGANLSGANLSGANLINTDLSHANLSGANLSGANLREANLREANLHQANLSGADLSHANLIFASLRADLSHANLSGANLSGANLSGANLINTDLSHANLSGADLINAILSYANLSGANLSGADLTGARGLEKAIVETTERALTLRIRITEEPLTSQNFSTIISILTELYTKGWLIQRGRFSDLINYAQTHDIRFTKEANLVIGKLAHNSPALVELLMNPATLAATATLALALKTAIDAIAHTRLRYRATELDNQKKALEIKVRGQEAQQAQQEAIQTAEIERQKAQMEIVQQQLEIEREQLELDRQRLEVEKNRIEIALEIASKMVNVLRPGIDKETKGMLVQTLLPNLLQLSTTEGLELVLPAPQSSEEKTETKQNG